MHNPPHPGRVLGEYLGKMSASSVAAKLGVTATDLSRLLDGKTRISADLALRLGEILGTSSDLWTNMQSRYDLWRLNHGKTVL